MIEQGNMEVFRIDNLQEKEDVQDVTARNKQEVEDNDVEQD